MNRRLYLLRRVHKRLQEELDPLRLLRLIIDLLKEVPNDNFVPVKEGAVGRFLYHLLVLGQMDVFLDQA